MSPMSNEFGAPYDEIPSSDFQCPVCSRNLLEDFDDGDFISNYPELICRQCDDRAVNRRDRRPQHDSLMDDGDNPVFVDGQKCWRRYRFGGFVTMFDPKVDPTSWTESGWN